MKTSKVHAGRRTEKDVDPESSYNFPLRMTPEFRTRIRVAARFNGATISQFIREAVTTKLELSEARQRQAREEKKEKDRPNTFRGIGQSVLAPNAPTPLHNAFNEARELPPTDVLPKDLYREHAKRIADALDRPRELRLRLDEAVVAIKKQWPLTHPSDSEIVERLEKLVMSFAPKIVKKIETTENDELLGRTLAGIKTFGYTPTTDDEPSEE